MARRKSGTELDSFEDARTHLSRPSDSSDASYRASDSLAEPMATHQYALLIRHHLLLLCGACLAYCCPANVQPSANLTVVWRLACCSQVLPCMCPALPQLAHLVCLSHLCLHGKYERRGTMQQHVVSLLGSGRLVYYLAYRHINAGMCSLFCFFLLPLKLSTSLQYWICQHVG